MTGVDAKCMYSDMDGDLWVGTSTDGLLRFKDAAIRMYTTADGLPANYAMAVLSSHDGTLWVGSNCGGVSRFDGQSFKAYKEPEGLLNSCVWSMAEDSNHDLWIGTWGGGIFRFRDGHFTQPARTLRCLVWWWKGCHGNCIRSFETSSTGLLARHFEMLSATPGHTVSKRN